MCDVTGQSQQFSQLCPRPEGCYERPDHDEQIRCWPSTPVYIEIQNNSKLCKAITKPARPFLSFIAIRSLVKRRTLVNRWQFISSCQITDLSVK